MGEVKVNVQCPQCGSDLNADVDIDPRSLAPSLRGEVDPSGFKFEYRITTKHIERFLRMKANKYAPDSKIELTSRYCEKKRHNTNERHKSYSSLRIAFSHHVLENSNNDNNYFYKIGNNGDNIRLKKDIMSGFIDKFKYDIKEINGWLDSYKKLEELEESFGMTEPFINSIKEFAFPKGITDNKGRLWILFSAAPENVIADMFIDQKTGRIAGEVTIEDTRLINQDLIEYIVSLDPNKRIVQENSHIRQILAGEDKIKK